MEEALIAILLANSGVATSLGTRVNWVRRPQEADVFPSCILQRVSGQRQYNLQASDGLVNSRVQMDVWASTYISAKTASRAIVAALTGYKGTVGNTKIQGIFINGERDLPDEDNDANNRLYRVSIDALIWHTE